MLPRFLGLSAYFSFNGSFLSDRHHRPRETFRQIPLDRLLLETDALALPPPLPHRAYAFAPPDENLNHPANIAATYEAVAMLREQPLAQLCTEVSANFDRFLETAVTD